MGFKIFGTKFNHGGLVISACRHKNTFNEINRIGMLWTFHCLWLSGSHFVFNFYRHWSLLVLWDGSDTASFLHSREGVTQGDPLSIITYVTGILPLIRNLKREIHGITQPCYAYNSGALGKFIIIYTYFNFLTHQGTGRGYYPEPSKIVLILYPDNLEAGFFFRRESQV